MDQTERVHRPLAFDKMEGLVREMQDPETGVPVRSQKLFLTSIPSAFMGYDLIEWLLERLNIEESVEAVHLANQLCNYGYFFPVSDSKNLVVKDDSSFYRFQTPYYWPWQNKNPDKVEYAIYLAKRTLRNKQRHGLEEYEMESLASLKKNLQNKWDFVTMQAEEQLKLAKERKKGDKIVSDSQERAYWRVYRPPPGYPSCLETIPVPHRNRGMWQKKKTVEDLQKEVDFLRKSLSRTRIKVSAALDNLMQYSDTFMEYDAFFTSPQPSNPWLSDDITFWQLNGPLVEVPTEKRVKRWALSIEDLVSDPTGLQEFTNYLRKQFSHENIRFWMAVNDLRRSSQHQIAGKVQEIFDEFLAPGAPCEINIDSKTMEKVHKEMKTPTRFTFDSAAEHVYTLLLKKDCYPRFIRSDHFKSLLAAGVQPSHKKRFFGFGGPVKKKSSTSASTPIGTALQQQPQQPQQQQQLHQHPSPSGLTRRRGSDHSLSGSVHELAICGVSGTSATRVIHSHSQSNLCDIPYRDPPGGSSDEAEGLKKDEICPRDSRGGEILSAEYKRKKLGIASCAGSITSEEVWDNDGHISLQAVDPRISRKNSSQMDSGSSSSELSLAIMEVSERLRRTCGITQQSSFPEREEGRLRKLSTTSADNVSSRRSSIAIISHSVSIGSSSKTSPRKEKGSKSESSNAEGSPVTAPTEETTTLVQQTPATVTPQRSLQDDSSPDNLKDDKLNIDSSRSAKKSTGGVVLKRSSKSTTPLISVSSVAEDVSVDEEPSLNQSLKCEDADKAETEVKVEEEDKEQEKDGKVTNETRQGDDDECEEGLQLSDKSDRNETSNDGAFQESSDDKSKDSNLSNWEEEENVVTPLVKTYATLGYL